jgi:hypothetical protein
MDHLPIQIDRSAILHGLQVLRAILDEDRTMRVLDAHGWAIPVQEDMWTFGIAAAAGLT